MAWRENINQGWLYCPSDNCGNEKVDLDDKSWEKVCIPHTNKVFPHNGFDDKDYQFISWYRKMLSIPRSAAGKRVFLDFDGVMAACTVFINGVKAAEEHKGGYVPFSIELTELVEPGKDALLAVQVDSTERPDIPPFGFMVDYLTFGGIYRDVYLRVCSKSFIDDVFAWGVDVLSSPKLSANISIDNSANGQTVSLYLKEISGKEIASATCNASAGECSLTLDDLSGINLWSIDSPYLYLVEAKLVSADGDVLDTYNFRFGFRTVEFCKDGAFKLNGKALKLRGLNRSQAYPYIGQAAPKRLQLQDADILKYDMALNLMRTSHCPQSPHFLDRCDEIGLLVFEELPGWQHIGDRAWKEVSKADLAAMIKRDRNRPSIILWGVRINESQDDHDFYVETNALAHKLDPTRQTGGVRCFRESECLEDVFTYNDFVDPPNPPVFIPYMITEFMGHMFPTKTWDCEDRKLEHAMRHAEIQSKQALDSTIAGAIGWCAFDYNTHAFFGSGDRICYHGVSDIFRLPKWAAFAYSSQADPKDRIVLEIATNWTVGDKSAGGVDPIVIFSNCDSIKLYVGDELKGEYLPSTDEYGGLPHPPFVIRGLGFLWGDYWQDLTVEGYIDGKCVIKKMMSKDPQPARLDAWLDSNELLADGQDMTWLKFRIVDKYDNPLPYISDIVTVTTTGPVSVIGTNPFITQGGQGALFVKASEAAGDVEVKISTTRFGDYVLKLKVVPASE